MTDRIEESPASRKEAWMREALRLAGEARDRGDHPFGAVVVVDSEVVVRESNRVITLKDPTQHAELRALQGLASHPPELRGRAILVTSTEPCAMCAGATYWAGVRHVIYGCAESTLGRWAGDDFLIPCRDIFGHGHRPVRVEGPLLGAEAEALHADFWKSS